MKIYCLQVTDFATNCYLFCDEGAKLCAVVDPGGDDAQITAAIAKTGCSPAAVLLTHGHYDHTGAVAMLRETYPDLPVYLNHRDAELAGKDIAGAYASRLFAALPGEISDYDEGDTVTVGSLTFTVMATPGHSLGSVCLLCGDILVAGDTLFAGSCGRTDLHGGSMETMMESLARLGKLEGGLAVLPGHGPTSDLEHERTNNPYMRAALKR